MPTLIDRHGRRPDPWAAAQADQGEATGSYRLIAAKDWPAQRDQLRTQADEARGYLGVIFEPDDDPSLVAEDLAQLTLIVVQFPKFTDGRGYSIARDLRQRYGWAGELRASGDILRDQLFYLARCGFDAFALRDDQNADAAIAAFDTFSEAYQAAVDRGPLFDRRRLRGTFAATTLATPDTLK